MLLHSLPSCFNNNNVSHSDTSLPTTPTHTKMPQNLITSVYQTRICKTAAFITLTWSRTQSSHSLTINIDSSFTFSIPISPPTLLSAFFGNKPGSKPISLPNHQCHHKAKLLWDFTRARFNDSSAEPVSNFYLAVSHASRIEFFIGDQQEDALRRIGAGPSLPAEPALVSRREHLFGQRTYATKAEFLGANHEIVIECTGGALRVKVDGAVRLVVKRLAWKFRGNERISVGGSDVEFYWDVFNWVGGPRKDGGGSHGVFVFQVGDGGVWPELVGPEKRLMRKSFSTGSSSSSPGNWSVLQWAEDRSEGSSRSCSSSSSSYSSASSCRNGGFSLLLYAWRTD